MRILKEFICLFLSNTGNDNPIKTFENELNILHIVEDSRLICIEKYSYNVCDRNGNEYMMFVDKVMIDKN